MNQRGFATLEVILMVMIIGILATVAVPRFNSVTAKANTAKIQSDLSTLDTAISIYYMENGKYPESISDLKDYVKDVDDLKPPTGSAYVNGESKEIKNFASSGEYSIGDKTVSGTQTEKRAMLGTYVSGDFSLTKTQT